MSQDTSSLSKQSFMDWAPRPQHGPVTIDSREVAEGALAAGMIELLGHEALMDYGPVEAVMEMNLNYPGFRDWLGWDISEIAEEAWKMATTLRSQELPFSEITPQED